MSLFLKENAKMLLKSMTMLPTAAAGGLLIQRFKVGALLRLGDWPGH